MCAGTRLEAHGRNLQADEKLRTDCAIPSIRDAMLVVTSAGMAWRGGYIRYDSQCKYPVERWDVQVWKATVRGFTDESC